MSPGLVSHDLFSLSAQINFTVYLHICYLLRHEQFIRPAPVRARRRARRRPPLRGRKTEAPASRAGQPRRPDTVTSVRGAAAGKGGPCDGVEPGTVGGDAS